MPEGLWTSSEEEDTRSKDSGQMHAHEQEEKQCQHRACLAGVCSHDRGSDGDLTFPYMCNSNPLKFRVHTGDTTPEPMLTDGSADSFEYISSEASTVAMDSGQSSLPTTDSSNGHNQTWESADEDEPHFQVDYGLPVNHELSGGMSAGADGDDLDVGASDSSSMEDGEVLDSSLEDGEIPRKTDKLEAKKSLNRDVLSAVQERIKQLDGNISVASSSSGSWFGEDDFIEGVDDLIEDALNDHFNTEPREIDMFDDDYVPNFSSDSENGQPSDSESVDEAGGTVSDNMLNSLRATCRLVMSPTLTCYFPGHGRRKLGARAHRALDHEEVAVRA